MYALRKMEKATSTVTTVKYAAFRIGLDRQAYRENSKSPQTHLYYVVKA